MPMIAWFYGIMIRMYVKDHPPPHFHAIYGGSEALVEISSGRILEGRLPPTAARLVAEWTTVRRDELLRNWERARAGMPLEKIAGLDGEQDR